MNANSSEIRSLTGLRGVAAWIVVLFHCKDSISPNLWSPWFSICEDGYLAVDLFFVLSGFVLLINYGRTLEKLRLDDIIRFYGKRFARVYPLHLVTLCTFIANPVAILLFSQKRELGDNYSVSYFIASIFLVQNWGMFSELRWNVPAWSISVEVVAYIVLPFMVVLNLMLSRFGAWAIYSSLAISSAVLAYVYGLNGLESIGNSIGAMGWFRCVVEFYAGTLIGVIYTLGRSGISARRGPLIASLLAFAVSAAIVGEVRDFTYVIPVFTYLIYYLSVSKNRFTRVLERGILYRLGVISYSTYLTHFLIREWFRFAITSMELGAFILYVLTVWVASELSFRIVETRLRNVFLGYWTSASVRVTRLIKGKDVA